MGSGQSILLDDLLNACVFAEEERFELVVINPAVVLGPVTCSATSSCSIDVSPLSQPHKRVLSQTLR